MWFKQLILALSLVSAVMAFNADLIDNGDMGDIVDIVDVEEEIVDIIDIQEGIEYEEEIVEVTKFNENGLTLKEGISSEEVLRIKRFFIEIGNTNIQENYYYDKIIKEIVMDYQRKKGLNPDGAVGQNTYNKINEDMVLYKINIPEIKLSFTKEVPGSNWIIINKTNNTLYHLKGENLIKKYPVATGKLPEYTPEGKFTIVTKFINPAWGGAGRHTPIRGGAPNNPLGKRWMGLNIKGGGVYGIHGNSDKESIGRYISLGCVRMYNEDVEYLFDLIDMESPVWIGQENLLEEYGIFFSTERITENGINFMEK